jgi:quercetin dioxygenase-like cupin family protein
MENLDIKCLVSAEETAGKVSVFEEIVAPGYGPPLHTHENQLEVFHVISGHIQFDVDGKRLDVYSGGTATIQPGVPHAFINKSKDESPIHFELLPSGNSEDFFQKLVTGEFDDLPKFFEDHGLKLLEPPIQ